MHRYLITMEFFYFLYKYKLRAIFDEKKGRTLSCVNIDEKAHNLVEPNNARMNVMTLLMLPKINLKSDAKYFL